MSHDEYMRVHEAARREFPDADERAAVMQVAAFTREGQKRVEAMLPDDEREALVALMLSVTLSPSEKERLLAAAEDERGAVLKEMVAGPRDMEARLVRELEEDRLGAFAALAKTAMLDARGVSALKSAWRKSAPDLADATWAALFS